MSQPTVGSYSTGGVLVGTDAPQYVPAPPAHVSAQQFSSDDLARAREQEKSKLYPQLAELKAEVDRLKAERDAQVALEQEHRQLAEVSAAAAAEDARKKAEAEMDLRQLLDSKNNEWEQRFADLQKERERQDALLQKEQQLRELVTYREQAKAAAVDTIAPQLLDLVDGNSFAEIDSSIARLQEKSALILEEVRAATSGARAAQVGVRPYGGPADVQLETYTEHALEPADIANMSMSEYMKHRDKLLTQTRSDRGLFG
jgi:hypothetical protein